MRVGLRRAPIRACEKFAGSAEIREERKRLNRYKKYYEDYRYSRNRGYAKEQAPPKFVQKRFQRAIAPVENKGVFFRTHLMFSICRVGIFHPACFWFKIRPHINKALLGEYRLAVRILLDLRRNSRSAFMYSRPLYSLR